MNHLLEELHNAGITVVIRSPRWSYDKATFWVVELSKRSADVNLEITGTDDNVEFAVQAAYDKWVRSTGKGLPELTLNQIEHVSPAPDYSLNKDPF